jgi:tRNA modification GTPase
MIPHPDDTIAALSSAPGSAPRAIVRVTGPRTWEVVSAVWQASGGASQIAAPNRRRLLPGVVRLSGVFAPLPAHLYFWPAPRTYTGQPLAELHTISSPPLVDRLIADLLAAGARPARPGEFTLRAFLAGKKDLTQAEAVLGVIEARTDADLHDALAQLAGGVTRPLDHLRDDLLNLLADVEAGLDFTDEGIEFVAKSELLERLGAGITQLDMVTRQLDDRALSGRPVRVVLVGAPNAGKSSLFNALAGRTAALVSPIPGTTRDYLTASLTLDGVAVELIDTAGWQDATDTIEEQAQRHGREQSARADVLLWCVPVGEEFDPRAAEALAATGAVVLRVRTKDDTLTAPALSCSVVAPGGMDAMRQVLGETVAAVSRPALAPSLSRCRHHVVAATEHLRSAVLHATADDPPELVAADLRAALDQIGELAGTVFTEDLLDRVFSRFCIGK